MLFSDCSQRPPSDSNPAGVERRSQQSQRPDLSLSQTLLSVSTLPKILNFMGNKPTISVAHLGCEKNRIDTEHMLGLLVEAGYQVDTNEDLADYVIVNTCSFIQAAREESVRTIVELAEANKKVVITGCMAQHFQEELLNELPEAVALVGTGDYNKIVNVIQRVETGER
ncbi:MAG TPA: hypothetical protein V6D04_05820, partial [Candidatus Obscuribacterales bacterium]